MSATQVITQPPEVLPGYRLLQLTTAYGPVFRPVKTTPPRDATVDEIPIIDVGGIFSELLADRHAVAAEIRRAATTSGFFYMKNHGVPEEAIQTCFGAARAFFRQPDETKRRVSVSGSRWFNGWNGPRSHRANAVESVDHRESFGMRYDPRYDPSVANPAAVPQAVRDGFRAEEYVWEQTANLPGFKPGVLAYWRACLALARRLVRVFALALDLPETYFDAMTSHPDAAVALNYYPTIPASALAAAEGGGGAEEEAVSIGSHTDLQLFTMLWQDRNGGLQVLTREGQWLNAVPVEGTFVVNIGDYLQRITNDRFVSTVHRAKNFKAVERFSMPFFFGFNFNETCGVLPSCVDEEHPAKYEPISCEEWVRLRFQATNVESKEDE